MKIIKCLILLFILILISCEVATTDEKSSKEKEMTIEEQFIIGVPIRPIELDTIDPTHGTKPVSGPSKPPGGGG
jgi:hypothetical protein